jgi:ribosome biogenesis GTPase A
MVSNWSVSLLCLMVIGITGCTISPTTYKPFTNPSFSDGNGYLDREIAPGRYEIQVRGNKVTSHETLESHLDRRAEELCGSRKYQKTNIKKEYRTLIVDSPNAALLFVSPHQHELPYIESEVTCL